jgi:hypothetical protein
MNASNIRWPQPWPIDELITALCENNLLAELVKPRDASRKRDSREHLLEDTAERVMRNSFDPKHIHTRRSLKTLLNLEAGIYPATCKPDIAIEYADHLHICEIKSGRLDYNRFDNVVDTGCRTYLMSIAHDGPPPWEVEQDILKLRRFRELSSRVGSCVLVLIDVPMTGPRARSWFDAFSSAVRFEEIMRTKRVRSWATDLLARTRIIELCAGNAKAQLIVCEVVPWRGWAPNTSQ